MGLLDIFRKPKDKGLQPPTALASYAESDDFHIEVLQGRKYEELAEKEPVRWAGAEIQHVYRDSKGFSGNACPLCAAYIRPHYVGLIYAVRNEGTRLHVGPCAAICDTCQVAVIDESLPKLTASKRGHQYVAPLSIFRPEDGPPEFDDMKLFKTYEGHEPLFVLDEEEYVEDVLYRDSFRDLSANHNKHRKKICKENRQRRKRERQARKRSRSH